MTNAGTSQSKLRLVMFTPATKSSAIGRMAALVTRALVAASNEVIVVRTESEGLQSTEMHDFSALVINWNEINEVQRHINTCDAVIYQIGNYYGFHEGGLHWLAECPGLVCLHDFFLGHLFYEWAGTRRAQAEAVLRAWHGDQAAVDYFKHASSEAFIAGTSNSMPMTEWICSQADAVISHSQWGCDRVLRSCPGPVRVVPLAYDTAGSLSEIEKPITLVNQPPSWKLITIGHINPNKRIDSVIKAIGQSELLKARVNYRLIGDIQAEANASLTKLAGDLGISLTISGPVDDATLWQALQEADAVCCLRWPALEAASASAIEAMLHGKAIIVTDTGFYKELPDDRVIKISPHNEIIEVQAALERLVSDPEASPILGAKAQIWAARTFTAENYAQQLVEILINHSHAKPSLEAIGFFFNQYRSWSEKTLTSNNALQKSALKIFEQSTPNI